MRLSFIVPPNVEHPIGAEELCAQLVDPRRLGNKLPELSGISARFGHLQSAAAIGAVVIYDVEGLGVAKIRVGEAVPGVGVKLSSGCPFAYA